MRIGYEEKIVDDEFDSSNTSIVLDPDVRQLVSINDSVLIAENPDKALVVFVPTGMVATIGDTGHILIEKRSDV